MEEGLERLDNAFPGVITKESKLHQYILENLDNAKRCLGGRLWNKIDTSQILGPEINFADLMARLPTLAAQVITHPENTIKTISDEFYKVLSLLRGSIKLPPPELYSARICMPKKLWETYPFYLPLKNLTEKFKDRYVIIEGQMKSIVPPKSIIQVQKYICNRCGYYYQVKANIEGISKCKRICRCGNKSQWTIGETIRTQQMSGVIEVRETVNKGIEHHRLRIEFIGDWAQPILRDLIRDSKKIKLGGIYRIHDIIKSGKIAPDPIQYLEVNEVEFIDSEFENIEITEQDIIKFKSFAQTPNIIDILAKSIYYPIYGLDNIKQALICQMFGGVRIDKGSYSRGDINILLIGDAGTAKTSLLKITQKIVPGALYTSGKSASGVGLTCTVLKDELLNTWVAEPGLFPLADGSLICVDELEKVDKDDRAALHEALSIQTISVSKGNVHATFKCRCGLLAAANPEMGRFDPFTDFYKQFNLPPTLMNRFDLIFPIIDKVNQKNDEAVIDSIQSNHLGNIIPKIDALTIKKYIFYAKKLEPKMTSELFNALKKTYIKIRQGHKTDGGVTIVPITPRQVNAIIRFAQASAKIKLRNKVTSEDLDFAIKLVTVALEQITHKDIDILETGIPSSKRVKIKKAKEIFIDMYNVNKHQPVDEQTFLTKLIKELNMTVFEAEELVEKYCQSGDFIRPRAGLLMPGYQPTLKVSQEEIQKGSD